MTSALRLLLCGLLFLVAGCPPAKDDTLPPNDDQKMLPAGVTLSGTVTGLEGVGLSLTLNAPGVVESKDIEPSAEIFAFDAKVAVGGSYSVFINAEPVSPRQTCSLANHDGLVPEGGASNINVTCSTMIANIGGKIIGLASDGLVLRNTVNGQKTDVAIAATQTSYTFADLEDDVIYAVSVVAHPPGLFCSVNELRATGTVDATRNVVNIDVTCEPAYAITGTVHGLSGSTGIQLTLVSDVWSETLAVAGGAGTVAFSFVSRLPKDTEYVVDLAAQPADRHCTARAPLAAGTVAMADVSGISVTCVGKVAPTYANAPRFGQWVSNTNPANACDVPTAVTGRGDCMHAGERRSVIVPGVASCPSAAPIDSLAAFDWSCRPLTDGIELFSRGFKPGKRLVDLLDFGNGVTWRKNHVTIVEQGIDIQSADSNDWFSNTIAPMAPTGPITDGASETINVITTSTGLGGNVMRGVTVSASSVIVVVAPGVSLVDPMPAPAALVDWTGSFGWFEGAVSSQAATAIAVHGGRFDTLRGLRVVGPSGGTSTGIAIDGAAFAHTIQDAQIARAQTSGITLDGIAHLVKDTSVYNGHGVVFSGDRHALVDSQLSAIQGTALDLTNGADVFIANVTIANADGAGIHASNASNTFVANAALVNTRPIAIELAGSDDWTFESLAVSNVSSYADFSGSSDRARFFGRIALTTGTGVIGLSGTTGNLIDATGTIAGTGPFTTGPFGASGSFVGATTTDQRNLTARNPQGEATISPSFDWFNFENGRRAWGKPKNAYTFGAIEVAGPCVLQCQIWDWSLALSSLDLRGVNAAPVGSPAPTNTHGAITYVRSAIEIFGDGVGNDNGFCEASERCVYTPNIGRGQGRGAATEAGPASFGVISDVSLTSFATF